MKFPAPSPALLLAIAAASVISLLGLSYVKKPISVPDRLPDNPPSTEHGRRLFVQSCAHCHGDDARGSGEDADGPDLYALRIGNARIAAVVRGGIPDEMPSFAKKYGSADIADLVAYLRTLN